MAKRRTKKRLKLPRISKPRASWRGLLTFGLVSLQVEAFNALSRTGSDVHFNQIHADCHRRIRYLKVCPVHGEVSNDEIVSGFEIKKDEYVEIEPDEIDALRTESDRALKIDAFISPTTVDPLYFDGRMYYLTPSGEAARTPYVVIVEAMEREERYGVGQLVMSGKDQIALIRPVQGVLHMAMLNYEAEIRSPEKVAGAHAKTKDAGGQIRMAQRLIEEWSDDDFDFSKYHDTYRERVLDLIEAKRRGHTVSPPEEEEPAEVLELMEALKKSVAVANSRRPRAKRSRRRSA